MASLQFLQKVEEKPTNNKRQLFEDRVKQIVGVRTKQDLLKKYREWMFFAEYLRMRTYNKHFTIHTNGDIDHYEVKEGRYEDIRLDVSDIELINQILKCQ